MEKPLQQIYDILQTLTGLHRQLLECVRSERQALVDADLKTIQSITAKKQALIESIKQSESARLRATGELALYWKKPMKQLTLGAIAIEIQGKDLKTADQFRSIHNTLGVLIQRISDQNTANRSLIEKSMMHINEMKKNALGEAGQAGTTYSASGAKAPPPTQSRLFSGEA